MNSITTYKPFLIGSQLDRLVQPVRENGTKAPIEDRADGNWSEISRVAGTIRFRKQRRRRFTPRIWDIELKDAAVK